MARKLIVLVGLVMVWAAVADVGKKNIVYANYEYGCDCSYNPGGGVFIYLDDWTFVDQRTGATNWNLNGVGSGAYYCRNLCFQYGISIGSNLCSIYGSGHKFSMVGFWDYQDPFNTYGGSGHGYFDPWNSGGPYECP